MEHQAFAQSVVAIWYSRLSPVSLQRSASAFVVRTIPKDGFLKRGDSFALPKSLPSEWQFSLLLCWTAAIVWGLGSSAVYFIAGLALSTAYRVSQ